MESAKNEKSHQKQIDATLAEPFQCDLQAASCKRPWNIMELHAQQQH